MGLFGNSKETEEKVKTCPNCGKELKPGEGIRKEDGHFCCDACCKRGPKPEKEKSKTCEFC